MSVEGLKVLDPKSPIFVDAIGCVCVSLEINKTVDSRRLGQSARCSMSRRIEGDAFCSGY